MGLRVRGEALSEIVGAVEAMRSGWLTTGPNAAAFEAEFADALRTGFAPNTPDGSPLVWDGPLHAVAVNSATAGLHLALEALGIAPGDEVLVPTWTFTATAEVVRYLGATPVIVDVDRDRRILYLHVIGVSSDEDVESQRRAVQGWEARIVRAVGSRAQLEAIRAQGASAQRGGGARW